MGTEVNLLIDMVQIPFCLIVFPQENRTRSSAKNEDRGDGKQSLTLYLHTLGASHFRTCTMYYNYLCTCLFLH